MPNRLGSHPITGSRAVVSRSGWGARAPAERYSRLGPLSLAVLHHTSVAAFDLLSEGWMREAAYMKGLVLRHRERGFSDIGYHFVIMPSGRVYLGRPQDAMGAHVRGRNRGTVGIALAGDFDIERPTASALKSLQAVYRGLSPGGTPPPLVGHGSLATTTCPGAFLAPIARPVEASAERRSPMA